MTTTYATPLKTSRPEGIAWSTMPVWFHLATFVYFATNIFNGWAVVQFRAPVIATGLVLFGLIGGFLEHISPYFPALYITPRLEKILFRGPTVVGVLLVGLSLKLAWFVMAAFLLQSILFLREKPLTSMEPRFHIQHVFGTHLFGALWGYVLLLATSGHIPALNFLLAR